MGITRYGLTLGVYVSQDKTTGATSQHIRAFVDTCNGATIANNDFAIKGACRVWFQTLSRIASRIIGIGVITSIDDWRRTVSCRKAYSKDVTKRIIVTGDINQGIYNLTIVGAGSNCANPR